MNGKLEKVFKKKDKLADGGTACLSLCFIDCLQEKWHHTSLLVHQAQNPH